MYQAITEKKPKVSVIMLTYNREKMVSTMIECILAQTFRDFEFIIIDNGSTDRSGEIAEQYAKQDSRIRVIHRQCGNIGSGRNVGISTSRGEYIAFVDDDDICDKDFLEFLYKLIENNSADISICGANWSNFNEKCLMNAEQAMETLLWRRKYNVAFPTKMFRRKLFDGNLFLEEGKYDDIYLMPRIIAEANKVVYHGISKYNFIRHETNNSAWTQKHELLDAYTLKEYLKVYDERTKWLCGKFPESTDKWHYFNWSFMISMVEKIGRLKLTDCLEIQEKMISVLKIHYKVFYDCPWISEKEKEWMNMYINIDEVSQFGEIRKGEQDEL